MQGRQHSNQGVDQWQIQQQQRIQQQMQQLAQGSSSGAMVCSGSARSTQQQGPLGVSQAARSFPSFGNSLGWRQQGKGSFQLLSGSLCTFLAKPVPPGARKPSSCARHSLFGPPGEMGQLLVQLQHWPSVWDRQSQLPRGSEQGMLQGGARTGASGRQSGKGIKCESICSEERNRNRILAGAQVPGRQTVSLRTGTPLL